MPTGVTKFALSITLMYLWAVVLPILIWLAIFDGWATLSCFSAFSILYRILTFI